MPLTKEMGKKYETELGMTVAHYEAGSSTGHFLCQHEKILHGKFRVIHVFVARTWSMSAKTLATSRK
eukprot:6312616-Amphidinium_carterae.1